MRQPGLMRPRRPPRALISGAGVAGPAAAYWLTRAGWRATLIETAPGPRTGGYMIDFWGAGFEIAERMGLGERLRTQGYRFGEIRLVDARGRSEARLKVGAVASSMADRYVSIPRADLSNMLLELAAQWSEVRFDEELTGLQELDGRVLASFRQGPREWFDLVIGADGLHSAVRRLAFPGSEAWMKPLGYVVAALTVEGYTHADELAYVSRTIPGRQVARYRLRDGRTTLFFIFAAELAEGRDVATLDGQKALIAELYRDVGWEARDILAAVERASDIYFDTVSQIRAPFWAKGRCVLVGDAAYCPSLLAGEGASFGIAGAYVLAGELARAGNQVRKAAAAYEEHLRSFIERKQQGALRMGVWFAPRTPFGLLLRNQLTRLAGLPGLSTLLARSMFDDRLELPTYSFD